MLLLRAVLAVAMILCGIVILVRLLASIGAGLAIAPGLLLAAAMIALGVHRLSLILRLRRTT
jgi:hypothetical protein